MPSSECEPKRFILSVSRWKELEAHVAKVCVYRDSRPASEVGAASVQFTGIPCIESTALPEGWSLVEMTDGTFERMT